MRGGMAVSTHNRRAGQRNPLLRRTNMNNAVAGIIQIEKVNTYFGSVTLQGGDLQRSVRVENRNPAPLAIGANRRCMNAMIDECESCVRMPHTPARNLERGK